MDFPGKLIYKRWIFHIYVHLLEGISPLVKHEATEMPGPWEVSMWQVGFAMEWLSTRGGTGIGGGFLVGLFSLFPDLLPLQLALSEDIVMTSWQVCCLAQSGETPKDPCEECQCWNKLGSLGSSVANWSNWICWNHRSTKVALTATAKMAPCPG